jgi:hypothetical protein
MRTPGSSTGACLVVRAPNGIRTRAAALKGRCPRPLDDGGLRALLPWEQPREYIGGARRGLLISEQDEGEAVFVANIGPCRELQDMTCAAEPDERVTGRDVADAQDGQVPVEERHADRKPHPERVDRPAAGEQQGLVRGHTAPAEEPEHAFQASVGDPDAPPAPSLVREGGTLHTVTVGLGPDTIARRD